VSGSERLLMANPVPVTVAWETVTLPDPELVRTKGSEAVELGTTLPKAALVGLTLSSGGAPVPESETSCGLPVALSETLSEAARFPAAEGVKVTVRVQLAPAATELPQVLV